MATRIIVFIVAVLIGFRITEAQQTSSSSSSIVADPCLAHDYKQITGVFRPRVCDNKWVRGQFECRDFAREACKEWRKGGHSAWKVAMYIDPKRATVSMLARCSEKFCGSDLFTRCVEATDEREMAAQQLRDCWARFIGHAQNVVEITDATGKRLGNHVFAIIEPQLGDPTAAVKCTWTQSTPGPVIPNDCRNKVLQDQYGADATSCGLPWTLDLVDCDTPLNGDPGFSSSSSSSKR